MKKVMELKNERKALWEQTKAFLDRSRDRKSDLVPAAAVDQYNRMVTQIRLLGDEINRLEEQEEIEREIYGDAAVTASINKPDQARVEADAVDKQLSPVDSKTYGAAFHNMIRGQGNFQDVKDSLSIGIDADGGYTVPDSFEKKLVKGLNDHNVIRRMAKVFRTESGMHRIPIAAGLPEAGWVDECAPIPETNMQFDRITLSAFKMGALLKATNEFLHDTSLDIEDYIADSFAIAVGAKEEDAFINGTGIRQPTGLLHDSDGAGIGASTEKAGDVGFDDIIRLYYSLGSPYRKDAAFLCNEDLVMRLMLLKDGNGNYIWKPSMEEGKPDTILGKPIVTSNAMPEMRAGNKVLLFGDFSYYWIADRGRRSFRRLNELFAVDEHVGFLLTQRLDARLILKDAMKVLKVKVG